MKAAIFFFALVASAAAAPRPRSQRNSFGKGGSKSSSSSKSTGKGSSSVSTPGVGKFDDRIKYTQAVVAASSALSGSPPAATLAVTNNTLAAANNTGSATDLQSSLNLDPSVVADGFANDGQEPPVAGQTASATTTNNFINFCALTLPGTPLTNGLQITGGSCNPTPIGLIPSVENMPSAKFNFPKNNSTIPANQAFNAELNIQGMETGVFTNAAETYFAAPQTLNAQGQIIGHSHFVIEALTSIDQIEPTDPEKFIFFKGVDNAAVNGVLTVAVTAGVPAGDYRICSINSSSNHQPVIVPVAQHGALDDCSYVRPFLYSDAMNNLLNLTLAVLRQINARHSPEL
ncbi:hypothetical protein B0H11DRAFT_1725451 [Mycena galericulata]|nr:hypothetical protein B0H11DRAFT_1725451 [Mycena galericulata]